MAFTLRIPNKSVHHQARHSPDYSILATKDKAGQFTGYKIFFRLNSGTARIESFSFTCPPDMTIDTVRKIRDTMVKAIEAGMIPNRHAWGELCKGIRSHLGI